MKRILILSCFLSLALAASIVYPVTLIRSPKDDSAIIESTRLNGNFAYRTVEGHAYKAYTPIMESVLRPVAVHYNAHLSQVAYVN